MIFQSNNHTEIINNFSMVIINPEITKMAKRRLASIAKSNDIAVQKVSPKIFIKNQFSPVLNVMISVG